MKTDLLVSVGWRAAALSLALLVPPANHQAAAAEKAMPSLARLVVEPDKVVLRGARAAQRLLVTGHYDDGSIRDLTGQCRFQSSQPTVVEVDDQGLLRPRADGPATITATCDGRQGTASVTITQVEDRSFQFARDISPVLSRLGCNQMGCHGSPKGKAGLRLSLFGVEPEVDFQAITRSGLGRLLSPLAPEDSLLLIKGAGRLPHGGGQRVQPGSPEYRLLADWIAGGAPRGSDTAPKLLRLELFPRDRVLAPNAGQRLLVEAHYSDGSMADVTSLAGLVTSDDFIATVGRDGLVQTTGTGEAIILASYSGQAAVSRLAVPQPLTMPFPDFPANNRIDELVGAKLRKLNIVPSELASDTEFLRRVYLDLLGIPPTPTEVRAFLDDHRPDKRARLIDILLTRPEFTDMWTLKWGDLLRINAGFPINLQREGMLAYHRWVRESIETNKPMDQFVRELLTSEGSSFNVGPANFYRVARDPQERAEQTATLFLGIRLDCAHCHHHPFESITWDDNYGLAAFFARVKTKRTKMKDEEVICLADKADLRHAGTGQVVQPRFLGGAVPTSGAGDPREQLAAWITAPDNPWFARNLANRVWFWLMGRGIVHEPDDFRATNPPSHPELLDYLAAEFVRSGYDLKHIFRLVLQSRTYQLSSKPNRWNESDRTHFSHHRVRRLSAEQLLDSLCLATGVPERYPNQPPGTRAAQLPDGSVRSSFLEVFGRPKRAQACECERSVETDVGQSLLLMNSDLLENKLTAADGRLAKLLKAGSSDAQLVDELYLAALSRFPTAKEKELALTLLQPTARRGDRAQDLFWALLNTKEFLFNH